MSGSSRELSAHANYLSPKLTVQDCGDKQGRGVFAVEPMCKGELVAVWGGRIVTQAVAEALPPEIRRYVVQVEDEQFLAPVEPIDAAELINHCCQPNCGLSGQIALVALRPIRVGEEITFDYGTTDSSEFLSFSVSCGKSPCRKRLRPDDWQRPDVQEVNRGHFSPYLQRRIDEDAKAIQVAE
ncbi:MAG: SET domain-containing protein [Rhodospirillaceae bacterium]